MTRLLLVLENHFFLDKYNNVWCDRVVDYNYLKRYLAVFDNVTIVGRTTIIEDVQDNKKLVSGKNVGLIPLPDFKGIKGLIFNICKIKKIIKKGIKECDCVIYRAPTHLSLFTYKEVIKQKKPLGLEFMMSAEKMVENTSLLGKAINFLIDKIAKRMCLSANGVSYVTKYELQKKYPCKALINKENKKYFTTNYSSIDLIGEDYHKKKWPKACPKEIRIIHTGYMDSYRKGQDILIKAAKEVLDSGYNIRVSFIGDGNKRSEFEELANKEGIKDKVDFYGLIKDKKFIQKIELDSHLFVLPTKSEGLPRSIIEAMSCGLPCIVSSVDGNSELISNNWLINSFDYHDYAKKIIEMLNDFSNMKKVGIENYNKSLEYDHTLLSKRRTSFYKKLKEIVYEK